MAALYDVEPMKMARTPAAARERMTEDFRQLIELGVPGVCLTGTDRGELARIAESARTAGMVTLLCRPRGSTGPGEAFRHTGWDIMEMRTAVKSGGAPHRAARASRQGSRDSPATMAVVPIQATTATQPPTPRARLVGRFHQELAQGRTGGLLLDRARCFSYGRRGLLGGRGPFPKEFRAALASLLARANAWGPLIARCRAETPLPAIVPDGSTGQVAVTILCDRQRRFVLVRNTGPGFARESVALDRIVCGQPAERLVEVPKTVGTMPGRLVTFSAAAATLPVELPPGEAVLLEAF